jgi:hypothetical protein
MFKKRTRPASVREKPIETTTEPEEKAQSDTEEAGDGQEAAYVLDPTVKSH